MKYLSDSRFPPSVRVVVSDDEKTLFGYYGKVSELIETNLLIFTNCKKGWVYLGVDGSSIYNNTEKGLINYLENFVLKSPFTGC